MKTEDVKLGGIYIARVSGKFCRVRIEWAFAGWVSPGHTGWLATNLATGRQIRICGAQRLRLEAPNK